jgi:hypothetical protein
MNFLKKIIYLNKEHTKFCRVILFKDKKEMQRTYKRLRPKDTYHFKTLGVHWPYTLLEIDKNKNTRLSKETGTVLLSYKNCGAGIVTHELMHAVLWSWRHHKNKEQYPITIKNMKEEEDILQCHTYAVKQFYNWFFKIENKLKN